MKTGVVGYTASDKQITLFINTFLRNRLETTTTKYQI